MKRDNRIGPVQENPCVYAPHLDFPHKTHPAFDIGEIPLEHKKDIDCITGDKCANLIRAEGMIAEKHFKPIRWK